jgi:hypothetical protein
MQQTLCSGDTCGDGDWYADYHRGNENEKHQYWSIHLKYPSLKSDDFASTADTDEPTAGTP